MTAGRVCLSLVVAVLGALVASGAALAQTQPPPVLIKEVGVEGARRVQEAVVLGRVQSKVGSPFNPTLLSEDIRAVFGLGFFDDVRLRVEDFEGGVKIVFVLVERPFVRDVSFSGNKKLSRNDLQDKIDLKLGSVYNPVDVQRAVDRLREHYEQEGYFEVQITPNVDKFPDGDVRVVFAINEGRRITIERIIIKGNQGLSEREIKRVLLTQEREYFILRGTLQRQSLDDDVERIVALYNDHGYTQARVDSHEETIDREKARVTITFNVVEGPQYRVDQVTIRGVTLFPESELRRLMRLKAGEVFSREKLRESLKNITDLYSNVGHASVEVNPRTETVPGAYRMTVLLEVNEGPEVYVERINISGNQRSQEKILRREIPLVEGDLFTLQKLQRARQRLVNLGYFENVNITTHPGSDRTRIILNVEVTERPTGLFSIGGGYSSVDSLVGTIDLSQRNFMGRGWELSARIRAGVNTQQGILSFTEPWLFDRPLAAGFDLFDQRRIFSEYDYDSLGGVVRMSHPFFEYWRWNTGYQLSRDKISNVADTASDALRAEQGSRLTSMLTGSVVRDSRDNVMAPNRGGQTAVSAEFAGLGGDSRFVRTIGSVTYFQPIWFNHVLSGRAEIGYGTGWGGKDFPLFERFYLGGPNSIRGFKFRKISPIDSSGARTGGDSSVLGNVEYIVPLPFNIRLAAFYDMGNVYGYTTKFDLTDQRYSAGGGVRWFSPFGPIRVDYGFNLSPRQGEAPGALQFSVGSPF